VKPPIGVLTSNWPATFRRISLAPETEDEATLCEVLRQNLVKLIETPQLLSPIERAACGKFLSQLGDPRPGLDDIVLAEAVWAASKSLLSGMAILVIIWALGLSHSLLTLWIIPLTVLIGLTFGSLGLVMTALAPSYDFFLYYFTLVITPMVLLCGVFFPVAQLPPLLQNVSAALPLTHAIDLVRPLVTGRTPHWAWLHIGVLAAYAAGGFYLALVLTRRRLLT
jgi:Nod factor-specific ABC transporter NodJ protein